MMRRVEPRELLAGMAILFIGILIGSFWLTDIGTFFVSVLGGVGSLATACTLVFLIYQNAQLQNKHNEAQEKADEVWKERKDMLHFQKYQEHQDLFERTLKSLETAYPSLLYFNYKNSLYRNIFPFNNFENCKARVDHIEDSPHLNRLIELINSIDQNLYSNSIDYSKLVEEYNEISNLLGIDIKTYAPEYIEVVRNRQVDFFEPETTINIIKHIITEIVIFTRLPSEKAPRKRMTNIRAQWSKVQYQILEPANGYKLSSCKLNGINDTNYQMYILILAYSYLRDNKVHTELKNALFSVFYNRDSYVALTSRDSYWSLERFLNEIHDKFMNLSENTSNLQRKEDYFRLSIAASYCSKNIEISWNEIPKNDREYLPALWKDN